MRKSKLETVWSQGGKGWRDYKVPQGNSGEWWRCSLHWWRWHLWAAVTEQSLPLARHPAIPLWKHVSTRRLIGNQRGSVMILYQECSFFRKHQEASFGFLLILKMNYLHFLHFHLKCTTIIFIGSFSFFFVNIRCHVLIKFTVRTSAPLPVIPNMPGFPVSEFHHVRV